jgi:hypothetical protein
MNSVSDQGKLLYTLYYEQTAPSGSPLDLSFDDQLLEQVEDQWHEIVAEKADEGSFMQFEERKGMEAEDEDDNDY